MPPLAQDGEVGEHPLNSVLRAGAVLAEHPGRGSEVVGDAQCGEDAAPAGDRHDAQARTCQRVGMGDVAAGEGDGAIGGIEQSGDDAQKRRLPRSVGAQHGHHLALGDLEVDAEEHLHAAVSGVDVPATEQGGRVERLLGGHRALGVAGDGPAHADVDQAPGDDHGRQYRQGRPRAVRVLDSPDDRGDDDAAQRVTEQRPRIGLGPHPRRHNRGDERRVCRQEAVAADAEHDRRRDCEHEHRRCGHHQHAETELDDHQPADERQQPKPAAAHGALSEHASGHDADQSADSVEPGEDAAPGIAGAVHVLEEVRQ